jgi:hypothetical protein
MHTTVSIDGNRFIINGKDPYPNGRPEIANKGILLNVRAVNAIFDDDGSYVKEYWSDPYVNPNVGCDRGCFGIWDADDNTNRFLVALPSWRAMGVKAVTINFQGGGPLFPYSKDYYGQNIRQTVENNGFTKEGSLKPSFASRAERIIRRADKLGMVVIVGLFYLGQQGKMTNQAIRQAVHSVGAWLVEKDFRNVVIEIANENDNDATWREALRADNVHELFDIVHSYRYSDGSSLLVSTSLLRHTYWNLPQNRDKADFVLIHLNGRSVDEGKQIIADVHQYVNHGKPVMINEDAGTATGGTGDMDGIVYDNWAYPPALEKFDATVLGQAGWGYYGQYFKQSMPISWEIHRRNGNEQELDIFERFAYWAGLVPESGSSPVILAINNLAQDEVVDETAYISATVVHPLGWRHVARVEFYLDDGEIPVWIDEEPPYYLGGDLFRGPNGFDMTTLTEGRHSLRVRAVDIAGHSTEKKAVFRVKKYSK